MLKTILILPLLWTAADNGSEINHDDAVKYCAGLKGGWRLPTIAELESLPDRGRFHLSAGWVWSADKVEEAMDPDDELSWGLAMANGKRTEALRFATYGSRALCVKGTL
jgi:hypothetical protein